MYAVPWHEMEVNGQLHTLDTYIRVWQRSLGIHLPGEWMSPRAGLDMIVKRKISSHTEN
jgi:hypothetical protein